jgi:hypothetical protein
MPDRPGSRLAVSMHRAARRRASEHDLMNTNSGTITVWQSGRLAPQVASRPYSFEFRREQWLGAGLLTLSAVVLAIFVGVLEKDVDRSEIQHAMQRSRAVAEAQCEADQRADQRGRCIALFNGDVVAAQAPLEAVPDNALYVQENAARAMTVSLLANR